MDKQPFGQGGRMLPRLGLGAMSFGGAYGPCTEAEAVELLAAARDLGIVHVDTANVYGNGFSESCIGAYIRKHGNPFHIATKAANTRGPDGARKVDNTRQHLTAELEASLRRLGVDTVDLFYVHRRDPAIPIEEVTETLAGLVRAGKTRAFGFSEIAPNSILRAAAVHPVAAVQSEYSLQTRGPELGPIQACARAGAAFVAFSPLGRGLLTDAPPDAARAAAWEFLRRNPRFQPDTLPRNVAQVSPVRAFARQLGLTTAGLAVAWVLARARHVFAIPGTRNVEHLKALVEGAERGLGPGEIAEVERFLYPGWCQGERYSADQFDYIERYC